VGNKDKCYNSEGVTMGDSSVAFLPQNDKRRRAQKDKQVVQNDEKRERKPSAVAF